MAAVDDYLNGQFVIYKQAYSVLFYVFSYTLDRDSNIQHINMYFFLHTM